MSSIDTNTLDPRSEREGRSSDEPAPAGIHAAVPDAYGEDVLLVRRLLDRAAPGHDAAWEMVINTVRKIIRKQVFSPVGDRSIEEGDLLQMVLNEVSKSLPQFRNRCKLNTWLHQVTINSLRRGHRDRNAKCRKVETVTLADDVAAPRDAVMEATDWRNLVGEIAAFLATHPDKRLLTIFYLKYIYGLRLVDIGRHLGLSTTRSHMLVGLIDRLLQAHPSLRERARAAGLELDDDSDECDDWQ